MAAKRTFLFVFPKMPGDVNPAFPVARRLVAQGHAVYFLSPDFKAAIEDTGATFLDATKYYQLYKEGRTPEAFGAANQLKAELGLPASDGEYMVRVKIAVVELEKKLAGVLQAVEETKANIIVYDPVLNKEAAVASQICKLTTVALLAFNGHGAWADVVQFKLKNDLPHLETEEERVKEFERGSLNEHNMAAAQRLNEKYVPLGMTPLDGRFTGGRLDPIPDICVVTTTEAMMAKQAPDLVGDSKVVYVGALFDVPGALRAGGPTDKSGWLEVERRMDEKKEGGKTVFVSMGTVTTADGPLGWQGKPNSSLTGEHLCQAVWGAAFDALGADANNVILCTLGKDTNGTPRPLASGDTVPENALCSASMPQVDILSKGIDLFVTHGGQNSFVESISLQTPMLVVPTAGDQFLNADQAVQMGIGGKVGRPPSGDDDVVSVAAAYRMEVKEKILSMLAEPAPYKEAVVKASSRYRAGGVEAVVTLLESLPCSTSQPEAAA